MNYEYKVLLEDEALFIGSVHTVERTADEFTFIDDNNGIVAMFNRNLVKGLMRIEPKIEKIKVIQPEQHSEKQLKKPIDQDIPVESGTQQKINQKKTYEIKQNKETKGYEVHTNGCNEANIARQEVAVSDEPITAPANRKQSEELVQMAYKEIAASGIYDPVSKKITVEKGTLIAKKEAKSLRNATNLDGIKAKRRTVLRKYVQHYNHEYSRLTQDIEFTSLSQACCTLSGTVLKPSEYWKVIG